VGRKILTQSFSYIRMGFWSGKKLWKKRRKKPRGTS